MATICHKCTKNYEFFMHSSIVVTCGNRCCWCYYYYWYCCYCCCYCFFLDFLQSCETCISLLVSVCVCVCVCICDGVSVQWILKLQPLADSMNDSVKGEANQIWPSSSLSSSWWSLLLLWLLSLSFYYRHNVCGIAMQWIVLHCTAYCNLIVVWQRKRQHHCL